MKIKTAIYTLFFTIALTTIAQAQVPINRQIIDSNGDPVPYVNVGVLGTMNGTVSDEDGWFRLTIDSPSQEDTLVVSAIGFKRWKASTLSVAASQGPITIETEVYELGEIVVRPKKLKKKKYGQLKGSKNIFRATVNKRGYEEAILVKPKKFPFRVKSAHLQIDGSRLKQSSFRIRFYAVDEETGAPGEELTAENYILTSKKKKGTVKLDLEEESIWFDNPVYVSFEWLINKENEELTFAIIDSITTLRNMDTTTVEGSESFVFNDDELQGDQEMTERMERLMEISRLSQSIPVTYYVISRKPKVRSYARSIFLDKWRRNKESVVGYLEVLHE